LTDCGDIELENKDFDFGIANKGGGHNSYPDFSVFYLKRESLGKRRSKERRR